MRAGQKSVGENGLQNALFPIDVMYITQGSGGGFSHGGTYAIDYVGWNGSHQVMRYPYYAPFDCTLHRKTNDNAGVEWRSDGLVNTPTGQKKLTLVAYHDNDVPSMKVGTKKKQGEFIGKTGTAGRVTGDHAHFELFLQGQEWQRPKGMIQNYDSMFIDGTILYVDGGYNWRESDSEMIVIVPIVTNEYLNMEQMTNNAQYIAYYLINHGWSANAISGMLGNMQTESTINPGLWQSRTSYDHDPYIEVPRQGYGLVQWTPFSNFTRWARDQGKPYANMDTQLERINYELENGLQWIRTSSFPMTFEEFKVSNESPEYLAHAFITNYERPAEPNQPIRQTQARHWFNALDWSGNGGGGGITPQPEKIASTTLIHLLLADTVNGWKF